MSLDTAALAALRELQAKSDIANTLAAHSRGIDRADFPLLRSAYGRDATVDYGFFEGDADRFCRIVAEAQKTAALSLHRTNNIWTRVTGDRAKAESYVTALAETPEISGPVQRLIVGRYLDDLRREDDSWKIAHRTYVLDLNYNWPGTSAWQDAPLENLSLRGGHNGADAGMALLALWTSAPKRRQTGEKRMNEDPIEILDELVARQQIHELSMRYCRAADRADEAAMAAIFHPDATVISGVLNAPAESFARDIMTTIRSLQISSHTVANAWVKVDGDRAVGEIYVIAFALYGTGAEAKQTLTGGRYLDRYERRDGAWKIAERLFINDFNTTQPATADFDGPFYASLSTRGVQGRADPVYRFWDNLS